MRLGLFALVMVLAVPQVAGAAVDRERSETFLQNARDRLEKGDAGGAVIELKNALQKDSDNVAARKLLGEIYLKVGNGPYAEKEFRNLQRLGVDDNATRILLARALLLQAKFQEVLRIAEEGAADADSLPGVLIVRGQALLGLRRFEESQAAFTKAAELRPDDVRPMVGLAQGMVNQGRLEDAEKSVDHALSIDGKSVEALILKGELRRLSRDLEGAVIYFGKAIEQKRDNSFARLGRAAALIDLSRDDAAQDDVVAVLHKFPRHPLAEYLSALILAKKKDYTGALDALQEAGPALDRHMPSIFLAGAVHYALNQLEQAINFLERYVEARPRNRRARKLLGAALVRKKEAKQAIEMLKPLAGPESKDAQLLSLIGSAYMQIGKFSESSEYFRKAAELAPDVASIRTQLALGNIASGKSDDAVGQLERALDLDPSANRASVLLALVKLRRKEFDGALDAARKLRENMPDNPLAQNLMGAAYLGKGDVAAARKEFEGILAKNPNFHPAQMNLAQIDRKDGNVDAANKRYRDILDRDAKHIGAMMALAEIALQARKQDEAISWLQQAVSTNPKSVVPGLRLVSVHGRLRQFNKALAVVRDLDRNVPNHPSVLEVLGRAETAAGQPVSAVATFARLAALRPKSARILGLVAGAQIAAKDIAAARDTLDRAISLDGSFLPVQVALIRLETREGKFDRAASLAQTLREAKPDSPLGDMMVGDVAMRHKKFEDAVAAYSAGLAKASGSALVIRRFNARRLADQGPKAFTELQQWVDEKQDRAARHVLANAYISISKFDEAIRESEKLLVDDGDNPILLNNLAWLYQQKKDGRAGEFAERALKRAPGSPAIMDTLGWILIEKGEHDRALEILRKAHELVPRQGDIHYHLAVALDKNGKTVEARRELKDLLDSQIKFTKLQAARDLLKKLRGG